MFIDRCELSYINNISASDFYRGLADVKKIIPSFSFPDTGLKTLNGVNIKTSYKVTENTQLTITIQNRVIKDEKKHYEEIGKPKEHMYNILNELKNYLHDFQ